MVGAKQMQTTKIDHTMMMMIKKIKKKRYRTLISFKSLRS